MKIAVIGAGLLGRLLALYLHRASHQVLLFDKDDQQGRQSAAFAAGGLLTPLGESLHCPPNIVDMGLAALPLWPNICASLTAKTFFQQTGAIMVSHEQDKGDYQHFVSHLQRRYREHQHRQLSRAELTQFEPELAQRFSHGLYLPQEGQLDNRQLLNALGQQLNQETVAGQKVQWLSETEVVELSQAMHSEHGSHVHYLYQGDLQQGNVHKGKTQKQPVDLVIDCRGTGASLKQSASDCAPLTDLRAVRGELFHLFAPEVQLSRPVRLMHPRYQLYIAPKQQGHYVVGASEIESDDQSPMSVRSAMELLSAAYSVHSGFAEANILEQVSQCRPAFSDNQPKIIANNRLIQVNGLYRHGFLIAPVVLAQVLALIAQRQQPSQPPSKQPLPYDDYLPVHFHQERPLAEHLS